MSVMAIIYGLCLFCGSTQEVPRLDLPNPQDVKRFCQIMAEPKLFLKKPITLRTVAHVLYGGNLLVSDQCKAPAVSMHWKIDYKVKSDPQALEALRRLEHEAWDAYVRGDFDRARQFKVSVVLEGKLEKNPYYHWRDARGNATIAAADYNEEYAFEVTRVVSLRSSNES